jgi:hypothetical protein
LTPEGLTLGTNLEIFIRNNPIIAAEITRTIRAGESPIGNFVGIFAVIRKNHIKITEPFERRP